MSSRIWKVLILASCFGILIAEKTVKKGTLRKIPYTFIYEAKTPQGITTACRGTLFPESKETHKIFYIVDGTGRKKFVEPGSTVEVFFPFATNDGKSQNPHQQASVRFSEICFPTQCNAPSCGNTLGPLLHNKEFEPIDERGVLQSSNWLMGFNPKPFAQNPATVFNGMVPVAATITQTGWTNAAQAAQTGATPVAASLTSTASSDGSNNGATSTTIQTYYSNPMTASGKLRPIPLAVEHSSPILHTMHSIAALHEISSSQNSQEDLASSAESSESESFVTMDSQDTDAKPEKLSPAPTSPMHTPEITKPVFTGTKNLVPNVNQPLPEPETADSVSSVEEVVIDIVPPKKLESEKFTGVTHTKPESAVTTTYHVQNTSSLTTTTVTTNKENSKGPMALTKPSFGSDSTSSSSSSSSSTQFEGQVICPASCSCCTSTSSQASPPTSSIPVAPSSSQSSWQSWFPLPWNSKKFEGSTTSKAESITKEQVVKNAAYFANLPGAIRGSTHIIYYPSCKDDSFYQPAIVSYCNYPTHDFSEGKVTETVVQS